MFTKPGIGLMFIVAYVLTGKLGLMFSPGESYASALFPPAGIALAAVLVYGHRLLAWVFLAALALNLPVTELLDGTIGAGLVSAVGIAAGSALQAFVGARLLRRVIGYPLALERGHDAIRFVATAAVTCLISATLATLQLVALKLVPAENAAFVWLTWWLGDTLGAILFAPMLLTLIGEPRELWRSRQRQLGTVLGCGLLLIGTIVRQVGVWEREQALVEFRMLSQHTSDQFLAQLSELEAFVAQFATVMGGANHISQEEFNRMARNAQRRFEVTLQAIEWAPSITISERVAFERAQQLKQHGFVITERDKDGTSHPAAARSDYVPVTFVEPLVGNEAALGFDLSSNPLRRAIIESAKTTDETLATPPLELVQEQGAQQRLLLVHWVRDGANGPGLMLLVLRMGDFMKSLMADTEKQLMVRLLDAEAKDGLIYDSFDGPAGARVLERTLFIGQRTYRLQTLPTIAYMASHQSWQSWGLLVGGLAFLGLLTISILLASARTSPVKALVKDRTTELEAARRDEEKANKLLREAVNSVARGLTIYDENDRLVHFNEAYLQYYETSRDLIVPGATFEEIIRKGAERGQYEAAVGRVDAWVRERVFQHQNAKGEVIEQELDDGRWLLIVEFKTPSGHIVGNRIDITEIKEATKALEDRNEQLDALFTLSPDGFITLDGELRVKYASPAFSHLTGLTEKAVTGLGEAAFSAMLASLCIPSAPFRGVDAMLAGAEADLGGNSRRELIELSGLGNRVLEVGLRVSSAETVSLIIYFRDVTHETEVDRLKSEFLSTAAHELRTPMVSVLGFSELLLEQQFDQATQRDLTETIHRNAELMTSIINELLDLVRIEERRGKDFIFKPVQARKLVEQAAESYMPPPGRDSPLIELPTQALWMRADPIKMEQALGNVISNAYKYSPKGGAVRIVLAPPGNDANEIGLRVIDRGMGMTPEQLARVCERFYRADTSGKIPGTGLGMSIVSEILALHGGRVEITSELGAGTEVTLWIRTANAPVDDD